MKMLLCTAMSIALTQRTWQTLRARYLPLGSIDGLLAITSNPLHFLDPELLWQAKTALFLGGLIWCVST
jgi:hypothetical protein